MNITLIILSSRLLRIIAWLPCHASDLPPHSAAATQAFLCCRLYQACPFRRPSHWQLPRPELVLSQIICLADNFFNNVLLRE